MTSDRDGDNDTMKVVENVELVVASGIGGWCGSGFNARLKQLSAASIS